MNAMGTRVAGWVVAGVLMLAVVATGYAQERPGVLVLLHSGTPQRAMALVPGLYINAGQQAMNGAAEPRALAVTITQVDGDHFSGELELVRLDANGKLLQQDSKLTGTIGNVGAAKTQRGLVINNSPPLTISLQDNPLRLLLTGVTGNMSTDGFRLNWQTSSAQLYQQIGVWANLVQASQAEYRQMLDQFREMAAHKQQLVDFQASSASLLEGQIDVYMQETDKLLKAPPQIGQDAVIAKAAALYREQNVLLEPGHGGNREDAWKKAELISMQIGTYWWQVDYIDKKQRAVSRYWNGRGSTLLGMVSDSPCMSLTSPHVRRGAAPACDGLASANDAVLQRMHAVSAAFGNVLVPEESMECLWHSTPRGRT